MTAVALVGASGRMGRAITEVLRAEPDCDLVAALVRPGHADLGRDIAEASGGSPAGVSFASDLQQGIRAAHVVIDFSVASMTAEVLRHCEAERKPVLIGTTGLDPDVHSRVDAASKAVPVLLAPNTSVGVTVLLHLAERAAALLGDAFDAEVVEMHHRHKIDAPSGTAVALGATLARAKGIASDHIVHGRSGAVGPRPQKEVGIMTLRGGDVVGDHSVILAGPSERLELSHRAQDRKLFANGAVRAARWLALPGRAPGAYRMADVLGLAAC